MNTLTVTNEIDLQSAAVIAIAFWEKEKQAYLNSGNEKMIKSIDSNIQNLINAIENLGFEYSENDFFKKAVFNEITINK